MMKKGRERDVWGSGLWVKRKGCDKKINIEKESNMKKK